MYIGVEDDMKKGYKWYNVIATIAQIINKNCSKTEEIHCAIKHAWVTYIHRMKSYICVNFENAHL